MNDIVIIEEKNNLGIIILNRPEALNSLNTKMCEIISAALLKWEISKNIKAVLIMGAGDRAFCAGGDIIMLHNSGRDKTNEAEVFWRTEYALNELIHTYKKPYIALIDGITMGGGVGISVHGKYRIAGAKTLFAMPETGIGYFPDVGGTYFLPRLGSAIGNWLGLTGARLDGAMAYQLGLATHYISDEKKHELIECLSNEKLIGTYDEIENILNKYCQKASEFVLDDDVKIFDNSLKNIFEELEKSNSEWAKQQLKQLKSKSPIALMVTLRALNEGAKKDFKSAMINELNLSLNFLKSRDFYEGIRAQVIDKDRNPKWQNENIYSINEDEIDVFFENNPPNLEFIKRD